MKTVINELLRSAETWDQIVTHPPTGRTRFWHSPTLLRLINDRWVRLADYKTPIEFICRSTNRTHFNTALAIGCGAAGQELLLLRDRIVERLILSDISEVQLNLARAGAIRLGLDLSCIEFKKLIDFEQRFPEKVDLIYWRDSLHHMLNTEQAIVWSLDVLQGDGVMYCHDACPPNRMQWAPEALDWVERFRAALPARCLASPHPTWRHPLRPVPESVTYWIELDPTECADSEHIVPALKRHAPQSQIFFRGGLIYGYGLNDILDNFDEEGDLPLFELAMVIDDLLSHLGFNYFFTSLTCVGP